MVEAGRSFQNTQDFVKKAYAKSFRGETLVEESRLDKNKPYTRVGNSFYQAEFAQIETRQGEIIPLVSMPIDAKPRPHTPSVERRPNASLLYIMADYEDRDYTTHGEIGNLYGVTSEEIRQNVKTHVFDLHLFSSLYLRKIYPLRKLDFRKPVSLVTKWRNAPAQIKNFLNDDFEIGSENYYETPYLNRFKALANPQADNVKIQALLDKIFYGIQVKKLEEAGLVVTFKSLAKKAEIPFGGRAALIYESLKRKNIPQAKIKLAINVRGKNYIVYYHAIAKIHENQALEILENDAELDPWRQRRRRS